MKGKSQNMTWTQVRSQSGVLGEAHKYSGDWREGRGLGFGGCSPKRERLEAGIPIITYGSKCLKF